MVAVVDLAGVTVVRGGATLLDDITWTVDESDRWVVIGPNGAGKTTLLQVLAAQIHPTAGVAGLLGEVLGTVDVFELRPRIGLTSAALAERIPRGERVHDVVVSASYAVVGRWREAYDELDHERADELLAQLRIDGLADRTFGTLSEGERKRVQIARALMTDPELLLLDEPAAGLDLAGREALVRTLSELAQDPYAPASVLVTHHVEEIPVGITHALLLKRGEVVVGRPAGDALTAENLTATFDLPLSLTRTATVGPPEPLMSRPPRGDWIRAARRRPDRTTLGTSRPPRYRPIWQDARRPKGDRDVGVNLTDWLGDNAWALWLSLAFLLAVAEILSLDLVLIMLAVGALAGAGVAVVAPDLWWLQILTAAGVSVGMLLLLRPTLMAKVRNMPGYRSSTDKMVGSSGVAMSQIDKSGGEIKVDGQSWTARPYSSDLVIDQGDEIEVYEIDGAIAVVYPKHGALP